MVGDGAGKTIIEDSIQYNGYKEFGADNGKVVISGMTITPADKTDLTSIHQGLTFYGVSATGLDIEVSDVEFNGWQYALTMNSGANNNALNVSNTEFTDTWCAMSVDLTEANSNTLTIGEGVATTDGAFAVQLFGIDEERTDFHYYSVDSFKEAAGGDTADSMAVDNSALAAGEDFESYEDHGFGSSRAMS